MPAEPIFEHLEMSQHSKSQHEPRLGTGISKLNYPVFRVFERNYPGSGSGFGYLFRFIILQNFLPIIVEPLVRFGTNFARNIIF